MNTYEKAQAVYHECRRDMGYNLDTMPIMKHLVRENAKAYDTIHRYDEDCKATYTIEWGGHCIHIEDGGHSWWEHSSGSCGELEVSDLFNRWVIVDYDGGFSLPEVIEEKLNESFPTLL